MEEKTKKETVKKETKEVKKPKVARVKKEKAKEETKEVAKVEKQKSSDDIVVSQKYTKEVFKDFASFSNKNSKSLKFIYICAAIIFVCSVIMFSLGEYVDGVLDLFLAIVFGSYGQILKLVVLFINKKNIDKTDVYIFEDEKFFVTNVDENGQETSKAELNYRYLQEVKENEKYVFIYQNKQICYILGKNSFKNDEECKNLINKINKAIASQTNAEKQKVAK